MKGRGHGCLTTQRKRRGGGGGEEVRERKEWDGRLKNAYSTTHTHTFTGREEKKKEKTWQGEKW